jgi:hypothetical protein
MFIRPCYRTKNGKRRAYWALVESYRTERGPRQRTVAYLGQLDEAGRLGVKRAAAGTTKACDGRGSSQRQLQLWEDDSPAPEWVEVDTAAVRVENELQKIAASCMKRKWKKEVIDRRVGRVMANNSRAAGLFEVDVSEGSEGRTTISWNKKEAWRDSAQLNEGCYLLRSNVTDWSPEELWKAYIQLTEAEAAFRIEKSDLRIRPIWHQRKDRVLAHILVCFLAYVLWKTLGQMVNAAGLGTEPRRVLDELSKINMVDVVLWHERWWP